MPNSLKRPVIDRISIVLRPADGQTLEQITPFVQLGAPVAIGRACAVISACADRDVIEELHMVENQLVLAESAMRRGVVMHDQDHLPALRRVIDYVPTLYLQVADEIKRQALDNGDDEAMAEEAAGQAIRVLVTFKQRLEKMLAPDLLTTGIPVVAERPFTEQFIEGHLGKKPGATTSMHIDDRVKMVGAEPAYLTVVFKLSALNDAQPLIAQLPYGQKALGTEAVVFGLTTGNLMEGEPCAQ